MSCPSENALNELVMGTLAKAEERAVRTHLDGCTRCRQAVAALLRQQVKSQPRPADDDETTVVNAPPLAATPIALALQADEVTLSGKPTGRYQLRGELGQGGMGEVYEVKDVDLKRVVALKRVRAGRGDDAELKRFIQEGQLTAQLEHPNIIPVHELGRLPSGEPFYTMKRVHGRTLQDVLAALRAKDPELTERYSPVRLGIVFLQIVQAIAFAHARGVVHCDLKPANVLLGEHGEVLVTDWGLALMVGEARQVPGLPPISLSSPKDARSASDLAGTPRYMAPEQLRREGVSPRSDVYALGLVLYELLTLEPARAGGTVEALLAEAALEPVPPRVRAPDREIPAELEEICLTALAV
ncbi:MAG: serine/threonine protein kinase, partial [Myxococcaceae bacterium]|nr:serine/threonine protein kinase [Myxococcaceae bacterium]